MAKQIMVQLSSQLRTQFFKISLLIFISLFISNCSNAPKQSDNEAKDQIDENIDPATARLNQAKKQIKLALELSQPKQNQELLKIVAFLYTTDSELNIPASQEYQLIRTLLEKVNPQYLSGYDEKQFILFQAQLFIVYEQIKQAEVLLNLNDDNEFLTASNTQLQKFYELRSDLFLLKKQYILATTELIRLYPLLAKNNSEEQSKYLDKMWSTMNSHSINDLKQQLKSRQITEATNLESLKELETNQVKIYIDYQLHGWQSLMLLIKSSSQKNKVLQKLPLWQQNFSQHIAKRPYIIKKIEQRFALFSSPQQLAIMLPLQGKLAKPAQAIINGILASHYQNPLSNSLNIRIYDTSQDDVVTPVYKQVIADGADIVIGPLKKKFITEMAELEHLDVDVLALNHSQKKIETLPSNLVQFSLSPKDEVDALIKTARLNNFKKAVLITPNSKWGSRLEALFKQEWSAKSGQIIATHQYEKNQDDFSRFLQQALNLEKSASRKSRIQQSIGTNVEFTPRRRQDIEVIFLVAFPRQAKQIPLQISYYYGADIPIYATSHIMTKAFDTKHMKDLDGIVYPDMPWILKPETQTTSLLNQQKNALYQHLFAFGVDSYQILPFLKIMSTDTNETFFGETGTLTIKNGIIKQSLPVARIVNGKSVIQTP